MPLQSQVVDVKFTKGQDTRTQNKLVTPGTWDTLINYSLSENNTPDRRDGVQPLVPTGNGNGLATYNSELLAVNGGDVSSYSPSSSALTQLTAGPGANAAGGRLGYVGVAKSEIRRSTGMQDTPDCATGSGFTCYVWREKTGANVATGINLTLIDETTGAPLLSNQVLRATATAFTPRVVFSGNRFYVFYIDGTSIFARIILAATPTTIGVETAIITSASLASRNMDAVPWFGSTPRAHIVYGWNDGVTSVQTAVVETAAGVPSVGLGPTNLFTQVQLPVATLSGLAVANYPGGTRAGIFATSTGAAAMAGLAGITVTNLLAIGTAATQLDAAATATFSACHVTAAPVAIVSGLAADGLRVFWDRVSEWSTTNALSPLKVITVNNALAPLIAGGTAISSASFGAAAPVGPQGPWIGGKAFSVGGSTFLPLYVGDVSSGASGEASNPRSANAQNTYFVLEYWQDSVSTPHAAVIGRALAGSYGLASVNGNPPTIGTPCSIINPSSGVYAQVAGELTALVLSAGFNVSPTGLVRLTLTPNSSSAPSALQLGESGYFAGGQLTTYDGANINEHGFPLYPEGIRLTAGGAGTGAMTDGVHQVVVIYEWVDNAGQRHQSSPGLPVKVTVNSGGANTGSIVVQAPTLLVSQKSNVQIVAFCTTAAGLTFFRVLTDAGAYVPVMNTTAATTVTFRISTSDATLATQEPLYTQPNQSPTTLPNDPPPPCTFTWNAHNRLWLNKSDKPLWVGYSQQYVNNVGLQFSNVLEASLPAESGGFVGGAALDEKIIIFAANRIYAMYGQGPQPTGAFNQYSQPQDIEADVGCSDAASILGELPGGILFKSTMGFHVLKRDLSVEYIGDGVAAYDAATVTSAVLLQDRKEARFTTSTGNTLVYSTLIGQWSVFRYASLTDPTRVVDAVWWPLTKRYVWIALANGLNNDVPGVFTDTIGAGSQVTVTTYARTAWLKLGALEGFQRVRWLYLTATSAIAGGSGSNFFITTDYDDVYGGPNTETLAISLDQAVFTTAVIDLRHKIVKKQKCKSIAFTFTDQPPDEGTPGLSGIQALALEAGIKKGVNRLPAAQSV